VRRLRRAGAAGAAGAALALLASCGVPTGGAPSTVAPSDVPYGLAAPGSRPSAAPSAPPRADPAWAYLLGADEALVPRARDTGAGTLEDRLGALLSALAAGPTEEERNDGLSTALPPGVELSVAGIDGGTATIDLSGPARLPSGVASRRAVAQIVLSATSLPGVEAVLLSSGGEPVEAPLPSGALTDAPLSPADYAVFLTPPVTAPAPAVATPAPPVPTPTPAATAGSPPFVADTRPDTAAPSPGAAVTLTDVRAGRYAGFDRVVLEVAGAGLPGWDARYVAEARSAGSGFPVDVAGVAVLQVTLKGIGLPGDTGVRPYAGPDPLAADGGVLREVVLDGAFEGQLGVFVGATAERPFRVYLLQNPTRVVLEVLHGG
jgi:hypothetical protein